MSDKQEQAAAVLADGFNCAQAVFTPFCEGYGIPRETALRLAGGLGGGCRAGEICGAASGCVLVVGLKHGQTAAGDMETKQRCGAKTKEFIARFHALSKTKALRCRDLLGVDTSTPEGYARAAGQNLLKTVCPALITGAVGILEELGY